MSYVEGFISKWRLYVEDERTGDKNVLLFCMKFFSCTVYVTHELLHSPMLLESTCTWLYLGSSYLHLLDSTMTQLASTWFYHGSTCVYLTLPWLYLHLLDSTMALLVSTWLYHGSTCIYLTLPWIYTCIYLTLPWLYLHLLDSTMTQLDSTMALLASTWLYHDSTWIYLTVCIALLESTL